MSVRTKKPSKLDVFQQTLLADYSYQASVQEKSDKGFLYSQMFVDETYGEVAYIYIHHAEGEFTIGQGLQYCDGFASMAKIHIEFFFFPEDEPKLAAHTFYHLVQALRGPTSD